MKCGTTNKSNSNFNFCCISPVFYSYIKKQGVSVSTGSLWVFPLWWLDFASTYCNNYRGEAGGYRLKQGTPPAMLLYLEPYNYSLLQISEVLLILRSLGMPISEAAVAKHNYALYRLPSTFE